MRLLVVLFVGGLMATREEMTTATDTHNCEEDGHCLHEGTAVGSIWCCKCHEYVKTMAERLGFYAEPLIEGGGK